VIGLINHLGMCNERILTIFRSREESILLSHEIEISVEEECAILSAKEISHYAANGPSPKV
jgi:hypothetical protein